jgi:cytochrome P450
MNSQRPARTTIPPVPGTVAADFETWPLTEQTQRCPFSYYAALQRHAPVFRYPQADPDAAPIFMVTGWTQIAYALTHAETFVQDLADVMPTFAATALVPGPCPEVESHYGPAPVFFSDGLDHRVKRSWALMFVDRDRLPRYREIVVEEVDKLIDVFAARGACDFRRMFSDQLPVNVLASILGLSRADAVRIRRWSNIEAESAMHPHARPEQTAERGRAILESGRFYVSLLEDRLANPRDDYTTELVQAQIARDGSFDPNALAIHLRVMLFGGDHAMGAVLVNLSSHLAQFPEVQDQLRGDPALIPQFVLESLRLGSPVQWIVRKCVADTSVGEEQMPAGSVVYVALAAGNRDAREFSGPEAMDLERTNAKRSGLALGRGAHRCAGAPLAQMEGEVTVERLLSRLTDIRLDQTRTDLEPEPSFSFRVPTSVHLTFTTSELRSTAIRSASSDQCDRRRGDRREEEPTDQAISESDQCT